MVYTIGDKHQESFVISEEVVAKFDEFSLRFTMNIDVDFT